MSRAEQLFKRSLDDPYNEVSILPTEGGITILLSHRITMDAAALVFVSDNDVLFFDRDEDQAVLEGLNTGVNWPGKETP